MICPQVQIPKKCFKISYYLYKKKTQVVFFIFHFKLKNRKNQASIDNAMNFSFSLWLIFIAKSFFTSMNSLLVYSAQKIDFIETQCKKTSLKIVVIQKSHLIIILSLKNYLRTFLFHNNYCFFSQYGYKMTNVTDYYLYSKTVSTTT